MHIYPWQNYPPNPPQLGTDNLNTARPNLADLPPSIEHRCLKYHYTKLGRSTPQSIELRCLAYCYTKLDRSTGRSTPLSIEHSCLKYCYTKLGRSTPQSIEHRCLEYHYTKLGRSTPPPSQSSIDALNTATPNLADLPQRTSTYERPVTGEGNYLVFIYFCTCLLYCF